MDPSATPSDAPGRVGVRELRQNLSVYLRRIAQGEEFTVTDHGRPVARLTGLPPERNFLDRLVAEGKVYAPPRRGPVRELPPLSAATEGGASTDEILEQLREDRL